MSGRRTLIRWPLYTTAWALAALLLAVREDEPAIVACAVLAIVAFWGMWLTERPR